MLILIGIFGVKLCVRLNNQKTCSSSRDSIGSTGRPLMDRPGYPIGYQWSHDPYENDSGAEYAHLNPRDALPRPASPPAAVPVAPPTASATDSARLGILEHSDQSYVPTNENTGVCICFLIFLISFDL